MEWLIAFKFGMHICSDTAYVHAKFEGNLSCSSVTADWICWMFCKISEKKLFDSDNDLPQLWLTSNHPHLFLFNTLSLRQNGPQLADDIFKVK